MYSSTNLERDELIALAANDLSQNKLEKALVKLKAATAMSDEIDIATSLLGKIYAQLKLFNKAIVLFDRFVQQHPAATQERFELGMVTLDNGSPAAALEVWEPLLADAGHPPSLFYSAVAYCELGDFAAARRQLDVLLKAIPVDNLYFDRAKELLESIKNSNIGKNAKFQNFDINLNS